MPAPQYSRDEVVARLMDVLRRDGYDGASIASLSKATGLGKSSLYHHFPNGKSDMVTAVLDQLSSQLESNLFGPLRANGDPVERLRAMTRTLDRFYHGGRESCLLASLGVGDSSQQFHPRLAQIISHWIDAMACVLRDGGIPASLARTRAEDALMRIQGALMLAHALNKPAVFTRTLKSLPGDLLST